MSEWKEVKLGDVILHSCSGGTPKSNVSEYYDGEIPWLNTKEIDFNRIYQTERNITQKGLDNSSAKWIDEKCVIIAMYGATAGKIAINMIPLTTNQACCNLKVDDRLADFRYIYYFLKKDFKFLASLANGGAQQNLNSQIIKDYVIKLPSLSIQKEISDLLWTIDAKIETNNKLNEKLEEMAQAIFKSWFVDFEPFKDKPFHETEIGYIPQIFESGVLGDLCTFKRGKGLLSKDAIFGNVPVIAGGMKPACYHNIANTKAPVVTVSGSGANAGYTQIHNVDVWASDCSFIDSNCENLYYVYCFLSRRPKLLRHSQTGAAQPHVKPADIHRFQVVIPTKDVINEFQQIVKPLFDRIGMNKKENDRLASLRDTLLPRLMSGELIV